MLRLALRTSSRTLSRETVSRTLSTVSPIKSGTELYMSLYPEGSTDGGLRLGNVVPDFSAGVHACMHTSDAKIYPPHGP